VGLLVSVAPVPLVHFSEVNPDGQVPLNTCKWVPPPALPLKLAPIELKVIVGLVFCATKEYHTSTPAVPPHVPVVTFGADWDFP